MKHIVIVGGGFAGITCALQLEKTKLFKITLISSLPHFEYHAALYRIVTGKSPQEVCIPLSEIFYGKNITINEDTIVDVNVEEKKVYGKNNHEYAYDTIILALGSETVYYDTPGLQESAFGLKSITEALKLKAHLHEIFNACIRLNKEEQICNTHIVIVGGGPTGTETAGELAVYTKKLAKKHGIDPTTIKIDLIQSGPQLLPGLPMDIVETISNHLKKLSVTIYLNERLMKEKVEEVYLKDMKMKTKTVIWTAGVKANHLYTHIKGLELDQKGRVIINNHLQSSLFKDVYIPGDGASTKYSGMAQTAQYDGLFIANTIIANEKNISLPSYQAPQPIFAIPVGPNWTAIVWKKIKLHGQIGWWIRRLLDLKLYLSILPLSKAIKAFRSDSILCETCKICCQ